MNKVFALGFVVVSVAAVGCAVSASEDSASTGSALVRTAVDCHAASLTPAQVAACVANLKNQITQPLYCDGDGGPKYECGDFSNTFCDGAHANDYACAEIGVSCNAQSDGGKGGGHGVAVVYIGGSCYAVEPQPGGGIIAGPWPSQNGSCNDFGGNVPDKICASVGLGTAKCTQLYHYGDHIPDDTLNDCRAVARTALAP